MVAHFYSNVSRIEKIPINDFGLSAQYLRLAVFSCTCPNARTHTLQRRCQRWLDGFGEDRYHLRQEVIAFAQTTDEVQALFGEEDDVMAGPRAKQLDGYVGATIDDEARDSSLSTATSFATTTHDRPEERRK